MRRAPRYLNVCTPSSVRPIAYESCRWGEKAWPTNRHSTRSRPCALRPRRMYSRVPPPAASRRTPSEYWLDGGRGPPVFRISEAYQDQDSNCTPRRSQLFKTHDGHLPTVKTSRRRARSSSKTARHELSIGSCEVRPV